MTIFKKDKSKFKRTKEQDNPLNPKIKSSKEKQDLGLDKKYIKETQHKH